jgi:hypothetical protein
MQALCPGKRLADGIVIVTFHRPRRRIAEAARPDRTRRFGIDSR